MDQWLCNKGSNITSPSIFDSKIPFESLYTLRNLLWAQLCESIFFRHAVTKNQKKIKQRFPLVFQTFNIKLSWFLL